MSTGAGTVPDAVDVEDAHIEELQDFFASRHVPFGRPEDLILLAERGSEEGPLRWEMSFRLRAIVRGGGEQLSRGQLMRLVVVAGGGPTVSPNMPELQSALWQIAQWVNTAFEQDEDTSSQEPGAEPDQATENKSRGNDPAAEIQLSGLPTDGMEEAVVEEPVATLASVSPQPSALQGWRPLRAIRRAARARAAHGEGTSLKQQLRLRSKRHGWIFPALVFAAAGGVFAYLMWPSSLNTVVRRLDGGAAKGFADGGPGPSQVRASAKGAAAAGLRLCVGPIRAGASHAGIEERSLWAHKLLDQKLYPVAFSQLRGLEAVNPGYPGVALDESDALLQMGQLDGARMAADAQVKVSACLAGLPPAAVDSYCREEFSPGDTGRCRPAMERVQAAAELQAAVVHLQLANRMHPEERALAALAALRKGDAAVTAQRTHAEGAGDRPSPDVHLKEPELGSQTGNTAVPTSGAVAHTRRRGERS